MGLVQASQVLVTVFYVENPPQPVWQLPVVRLKKMLGLRQDQVIM